MEKAAKKIANFELRADDIWIVTYPKCGTTLTQVAFLIFLNNIVYYMISVCVSIEWQVAEGASKVT